MIGNREEFHEWKSVAYNPEDICGDDQATPWQRGGHHICGQRKPSQGYGDNRISNSRKGVLSVYFT